MPPRSRSGAAKKASDLLRLIFQLHRRLAHNLLQLPTQPRLSSLDARPQVFSGQRLLDRLRRLAREDKYL